MLLFLKWRSLLVAVGNAILQYREEEHRFLACIAHDVWDVWRARAQGLNLFEAIHAQCTHGVDFTKCKNIGMDNEKDIILMLTRMSQNEAYATEVLECARAHPNHYKAPSHMRVKRAERELSVLADDFIHNHMRLAIWKEHLSEPMTVLECYLCCSEGIQQLGMSRIPHIWTVYSKMKSFTLKSYKRLTHPAGGGMGQQLSYTVGCRQCGGSKGKLTLCRECRCVYFCAQGPCARNSREDRIYGHTKDECHLFMTRRSASIQTLVEDQKTSQTQPQ